MRGGANIKTETFVNLTNDILFKYVFSHEEVTFDLLKSFFNYIGIPKEIESIQVFKDYSIYGTNMEDKVFYSDIVAILEDTEYISIEMYTLCEASHKLYYEKKNIM